MSHCKTSSNCRFSIIAICIGLVLTCGLATFGQESYTKPFVLNPLSPASAGQAMVPSVGQATVRSAGPATMQPTPADPLGSGSGVRSNPQTGNLLPQPLEPIPAGHMPGAAARGRVEPMIPNDVRPGEVIYIGPDGRIEGRSGARGPHRAGPRRGGPNNQPTASGTKIDYSMAPVQPAVQPRLASRGGIPNPSQPRARIVDGAPLVPQQAMVSADRPQPKQPRANSPDTSNSPLLSGVRRFVDSGRFNTPRLTQSRIFRNSQSRSSGNKCPKCGKPKGNLRVASKPLPNTRQ